jgi:mono/diheme cytochrome c family protein
MYRSWNLHHSAPYRGIEASSHGLGTRLIRCLGIAALGLGATVVVVGTGIASDRPAAADSRPDSTPDSPSPTQVYRSACLECHDGDGRGQAVRDAFPAIPDFTNPGWHDSRADADLSRAILDGKGKMMRPMKKKLGSLDVTQMVSFVRAFRGGGLLVQDEAEKSAAAEAEAEAEAKAKEGETGGPKPAESPRPPARATSARPAPAPAGSAPAARVAPLATSPVPADRSHAASALYRRHCVSCHGPDGRGSEMRATLPSVPDFSTREWQMGRTNAQLSVSILEGKGESMPAWRGRVSGEQARDLVSFVRSLGPPELFTAGASASDFARRFRRLQEQWEELDRQVKTLPRP